MTNYERGRSFEYYLKKKLEEEGFLVIRSAGSKGIFDLVAIKEEEVYLIQCKKNKRKSFYDYKVFQEKVKNVKVGEKIKMVFAFVFPKEVDYEEVKRKVNKEVFLFHKGKKYNLYFVYL